MTTMVETRINGKWTLLLPEHRAARPHWGKWEDPATGAEMFGWEVARLDSMHRNIKRGDVVFDIGAEEGDLSALFASWAYAGRDAKGNMHGGICLFEPNERVWPNIRAIWEANEIPDPIATFVGFAGHEDNLIDINGGHPWPECSKGEVIGDHGFCQLGERPDIPSIRLDTFVDVGGLPDILTIDVEGAEFLVLLGAKTILEEVKPLVYVSIHPAFMKEHYGQSHKELHQYMVDLGYREKHLEDDHEEHWVFWNPLGRDLVF